MGLDGAKVGGSRVWALGEGCHNFVSFVLENSLFWFIRGVICTMFTAIYAAKYQGFMGHEP